MGLSINSKGDLIFHNYFLNTSVVE
jgi:hypothetical protein